MDEVYSLALLMSLVAGTIAVLIAALERVGWVATDGMSWVLPASIVAGLGLLVSLVAHVGWGHAPGGPNALSPISFLREHPSFFPAVSLPVAAWLIRGRRSTPESTS